MLPGINVFFTLEGITKKPPENTEMNHIDIESLANDNKDLYLNKFFEENPQNKYKNNQAMNPLHLSHSQKLQREPEREIKSDFRQQQHQHHHHEHHHQQQQQPTRHHTSFFNSILPRILEDEFDKVPWDLPFEEFEPSQVFNHNIENVIYLQNINNDVQYLQQKAYKNVLEQLRRAASARPVTGRMLTQILTESFLQQMSELFHYIKMCDNDHTLHLIKSQTNSHAQHISKSQQNSNMMVNEGNYNFHSNNGNQFLKPTKPNDLSSQGLFSPPNTHSNSVSNGAIYNKIEAPTSTSVSVRESQSIIGSELDEMDMIPDGVKKTARKFWTENEQAEIEELCRKYHPSSVPTDKLEAFAKKYGRTLTSVQTKAQKVKGLIAKKEQDLIMETMNKGPGIKLTSSALSQTQNSMTNSLSNPSQRYEVSLEKMIRIALGTFPNKTATKDQILDKIGELYFANQANVIGLSGQETWRNSVSQLLSSKKIVKRIRGTYTLASRDLINTNIAQATTLKTRLIYILSTEMRYCADFETIKRRFEEQFKTSLTYEQEKNWEKSVRKILTQSPEFDSSNSKTRYMLIADSSSKLE